MTILTVLFFGLINATFAADFSYSEVTTVQTEMAPSVTTTKKFISDQKMATYNDSSIHISDFSREMIWVVDLKAKTYTEQTFRDFYDRIKKIVNGPYALEMNEKIMSAQEIKTLEGIKCRVIKEEITTKMKSAVAKSTAESCYAVDPPKGIASVNKMQLKAMAKYLDQDLIKRISAQMKLTFDPKGHDRSLKLRGRLVSDTAVPGAAIVPGMKTVTTTEVTDISEKKIEASVFEVPTGFKKVQSLKLGG